MSRSRAGAVVTRGAGQAATVGPVRVVARTGQWTLGQEK